MLCAVATSGAARLAAAGKWDDAYTWVIDNFAARVAQVGGGGGGGGDDDDDDER